MGKILVKWVIGLFCAFFAAISLNSGYSLSFSNFIMFLVFIVIGSPCYLSGLRFMYKHLYTVNKKGE